MYKTHHMSKHKFWFLDIYRRIFKLSHEWSFSSNTKSKRYEFIIKI